MKKSIVIFKMNQNEECLYTEFFRVSEENLKKHGEKTITFFQVGNFAAGFFHVPSLKPGVVIGNLIAFRVASRTALL